MRRLLLAATCLALFSAIPVRAEVADPLDAVIAPIAGKVFSEQNLSLLFGLLRQSLSAAGEGRPAPEISVETAAQLETAGRQLQKDALSASAMLIDQVEREIRESLRNDIVR